MSITDETRKKIIVSDWIKSIKTLEELITQIGHDTELSSSFKDLRVALQPYERSEYHAVLAVLQRKESKQVKTINKSILDGLTIENMSLEELKPLITDKRLSKNELLVLAGKALKMPIGSLKKIKKTDIQQKMLNVLQNTKKLETIAKQASS